MRRAACLPLLAVLGACAAGAAGAPTPSRPVHPGFDTSIYPGDALLQNWRQSSPYRWIGYYLPAPCHRETSWVGKREKLERMGWGIGVLYVGQQAFEGHAPPDPLSGAPIICSSTLLRADQGQRDARDAATRAAAEGFARGSIIYLDVERMQAIPPSMLEYYRAWQRELLADARYVPGTYAHQLNAPALFAEARAAYRDAGRAETPPFWIAGGRDFRLDSPPWAVGLPYARIWQGAVDVRRSWGGADLLVDENVSENPSPSSPAF